MNTKSSVRFGIVLGYDENKNVGYLRVNGERQEVRFTLDSQRVVVDGVIFPQFGKEAPKETIMPGQGAQVVVALKERYELKVQPGHRILNRVVEAAGWNYAFTWKDSEQRIAQRPVYEVVEFTLYKGEPVSEKPRLVITTGTADAIQTQYPRGVKNDLLATERKVLDLVYRCRFQPKGKDGQWVDDPRPLPLGAKTEKVAPLNSSGLVLADDKELKELLELANSVGGRRNGTSTPKPAEKEELVPA